MRGALVKAGGGYIPKIAVAQREGMTHIAWEATDPNLDTKRPDGRSDLIAWAHEQGFLQVAIQSGAVGDGSPEALAKYFSQRITQLGAGAPGKTPVMQLGVMPDNEAVHDPAWFVALYKAFRALRAAREIYLTVEWHQAGWFSSEMTAEITSDFRMFLLPQCYVTGLMNPVDPRPVEDDCTMNGIQLGDVQTFIRNDRMDIGWRGWIYNLNEAA